MVKRLIRLQPHLELLCHPAEYGGGGREEGEQGEREEGRREGERVRGLELGRARLTGMSLFPPETETLLLGLRFKGWGC